MIATLFVTSFSSKAYAAGFILNAELADIRIFAPASGACSGVSGCAMVHFTANTTAPACTNPSAYFIIDLSTTKGKSWLNLLTAAKLAGRRVNAIGTGACLVPTGVSSVEVLGDLFML